jgi:NADPH-dependent glutamate synthase beta subunit-like oxidoreductase
VGRDITLAEMRLAHHAVFVATGAHKGLKMNVDGESTPQVIDAVDFLREVNLGKDVEIGQRVAVIGGGNSAVDAARVARRLGKEVFILYRRTRDEMPALPEEVEELEDEDIGIQFLVAPVRVIREGGRVKGLECIRMKLGDVDKSGRRRPMPVEGSEFSVELDTVISAIGQEPEIGLVRGDEFKVSRWNTLEVDPETLLTGADGVFAGGDVVSGPSAVVSAMAHGKTAAKMIHKYLQGQSVEREYQVTRPAIDVELTELTEEEI